VLASLAAIVVGVVACRDPASADDGSDDGSDDELTAAAPLVGEYTLTEVGSSALPYVRVLPLCTQAFKAGALALRIVSNRLVFHVQGTVRQDCPGPGPSLEFTSAWSGTWSVFGDSIRFLRVRPDNGLSEEVTRGRADGESVAVRGLVTWPGPAVEEVYRRN
jgi:hypothetical protein